MGIKEFQKLGGTRYTMSSFPVQDFYDSRQGEEENRRRLHMNYMYYTINEVTSIRLPLRH